MSDKLIQDRDGAGKEIVSTLTDKVGTDGFRTAIVKDGDTTTMLRTKGGMPEVTVSKSVTPSCKLFPLVERDEDGEDTQDDRRYHNESPDDERRVFSYDGLLSIPSSPLKLIFLSSAIGRLNVWLNNFSTKGDDPTDWSAIQQIDPSGEAPVTGGRDVTEVLRSVQNPPVMQIYKADEYKPKAGGDDLLRRYFKPLMLWRKNEGVETPDISFVIARLKNITLKVAGLAGRYTFEFSRINPNTHKPVSDATPAPHTSEKNITSREYEGVQLRRVVFTGGSLTVANATAQNNPHKNGGLMSPLHNELSERFILEEKTKVQTPPSSTLVETSIPANDLSTILTFGQPRHGLLNLDTGDLMDPTTFVVIGNLGVNPYGASGASTAIAVQDMFWDKPLAKDAPFGDFEDVDGHPVKHTRFCPIINGAILPKQGETIPLLESKYNIASVSHTMYFLYRDDTGGRIYRLLITIMGFAGNGDRTLTLRNAGRFDDAFDKPEGYVQPTGFEEGAILASIVIPKTPDRHLNSNGYGEVYYEYAYRTLKAFHNGKTFSFLGHVYDVSGDVEGDSGIATTLRVSFPSSRGISEVFPYDATHADVPSVFIETVRIGSDDLAVNPGGFEVVQITASPGIKPAPPTATGFPSSGSISGQTQLTITGSITPSFLYTDAFGVSFYQWSGDYHKTNTEGSTYYWVTFYQNDILVDIVMDRDSGDVIPVRVMVTRVVENKIAAKRTTEIPETTINDIQPGWFSQRVFGSLTWERSGDCTVTHSTEILYGGVRVGKKERKDTTSFAATVDMGVQYVDIGNNTHASPQDFSRSNSSGFGSRVIDNYGLNVIPPVTMYPQGFPPTGYATWHPHGDVRSADANDQYRGVTVMTLSNDAEAQPDRVVYYKTQALDVPDGHTICYNTETDEIQTVPFAGRFVII